MRAYLSGSVSGACGVLGRYRVPLMLALIFFASAAMSMATTPTYTLPDAGFDPDEITGLGNAALTGWSGYMKVVLPIAVIIGVIAGAVAWALGLFGARRKVAH